MQAHKESSPWLVSFSKNDTCQFRLFCFPYAGGGAQVFSKWQYYLSDNVEVIAVSLPGREAHYRKTAIGDWPVLIENLMKEILPLLDRPYFFFGHSLGARICYELAHQLCSTSHSEPKKIFVSACSAPGIETTKKPIHEINLDELIVCLEEMGGVPKEVLKNRPLMKMLEPVLKADFKSAETWYGCRNKINVPIIALSGQEDVISPTHSMLSWADFTSKEFLHHKFSGGHFFLNDYLEKVLFFVKKQFILTST